MIQKVKDMIENIKVSLKNAYSHDIIIGWGTDVQLPGYQKNPYAEFQMRKELLDYENIDILKQVTINSAKLLMKDDKIGTVKEGKYADLIVVDGNPVEDINVMYTPPIHIIKDGILMR